MQSNKTNKGGSEVHRRSRSDPSAPKQRGKATGSGSQRSSVRHRPEKPEAAHGRRSTCKAEGGARRTIDVMLLEPNILNIERFDLLRQLDNGTIECAIADSRWRDREHVCNGEPADTDASMYWELQLCPCLELLKEKLAPTGLIFLFARPDGFDDPRMAPICKELWLKHVGKIIWQRKSGGFRRADLVPRVVHEEIHILCHSTHTPKSLSGSINSITPKITYVQLMEQLIKISTSTGLVVDLFAGSGFGGVAAARLNCSYIGVEPVRELADSANHRVALAKGENDEVVEAVEFALQGASAEQRDVICRVLADSGLGIVAPVDGETRS